MGLSFVGSWRSEMMAPAMQLCTLQTQKHIIVHSTSGVHTLCAASGSHLVAVQWLPKRSVSSPQTPTEHQGFMCCTDNLLNLQNIVTLLRFPPVYMVINKLLPSYIGDYIVTRV